MENVIIYKCAESDFSPAEDEINAQNHLAAALQETCQEIENAYDPGDGTEDGHACWYDARTRLLISLYKETKPLLEQGRIRTMKKLWEKIKEGMASKNYEYSIKQLENKWKSLERSYKMVLENRKKPGTNRGRRHFTYERELREILERRNSINSAFVLKSSSTSSEHFRSTTPETINKATRGNKPNSRLIMELQELKKLVSEANAAKMEQEEKMFQQRQEIIAQLKLKNNLLQKLLDKQN